MKVFESKIYAKNSGNHLPFKIVVEESRVQDTCTVEVKKLEYIPVGEKNSEKERLVFTTAWAEKQMPIMCLGSDEVRGSSLMFEFGNAFLDIMKKGGKTVLAIYNEENDDLVDESWIFKDEKYVCENKNLSYALEEFVAYMDEDNCNNIDVFLGDELKISVCPN